ncbi:winged helix-turn-helix domain-containing protein [Mesorhizobium sp. LHD-90]|uniref:winged helix-turn-helix domain-containing tetratricopeptide repeat protein n=1 Tax=Mesorhizobium sp. LHD-90 TaxID=3071414 RepID=UPI0027E19000|nr:winged helix-turn-helix domain-containing protein [Mesorhizobium sp. LHD-90]MDQ6436482.1 winged helix-turn-helix domain-containing protein [Mesorhizobium sp. LHD-90]
MDSPAHALLRLNDRTVDLQRGTVADAAGHKITLRAQAAEVLKVLAARPGQLVGKDELVQAVWGSIAVTDDSLVQCIKEIRKALGDEAHEIVKTVHKRGYVLEPVRTERAWTLPRRRWIALAAGATVLAALAGVYLWPTEKPGAEPPVIAVLPFQNLSEVRSWDRLADGLTEDIITDLARFRDVPVVARTSTEVYRGKAYDVREVGRALNADYVLEGSLQVDGYRTRVTAQLIDTRTGVHVWSERYDRDAAEFFPIQDEITEKIAVTLTGWQGQIVEAERALARRKNAADLDASDYWLLGTEAKHKMTPQGLTQGRVYFEKGLKLAPDFMPLLRDMAVSYSVELDLGSGVDYAAAVGLHRTYAEKAYALEPNDASANFQMGVARANEGDFEGEGRFKERALQLNPNNADNLMCLVWAWGGWQTDRAIELVDRAQKLSPRHPPWWNFPIAQAYFAARRFDKAYEFAKQAGVSPNQAAYVAMTAARLGKKTEAAEAAAKVLQLNPDWTAESMFPYQNFEDEALLPESAAKAGLPVCMTAAQVKADTSPFRFRPCEEARARAASGRRNGDAASPQASRL